MNRGIKKFIVRAVPFIFYALLLVFLILYLRTIDFTKLSHIHFDWWYLGVASIFALSFRYWGAFIWTVILRSLGASNASFNHPLIYIYAKSWLGRYIPGTAPWILGKIYFAAKQGISKNKLAVSSLLEAGLQIIVQLVFALALLAFDPRLNIISGDMKIVIVVVMIILLVSLTPPVFNRVLRTVYRLIKHKVFPAEHLATNRTVGVGFMLYIFGSVLASLSLFFIAKAVYSSLSYHEIFFVMGVSTLAGAASMLAVFAPSGIGVREGIQLALLSLIMPTEIALVITIITRLWSVVIDLLFFVLARLMNRSL